MCAMVKNHLIKMMLENNPVSIKFCGKEFGSKDFGTHRFGSLEG